MQASCTAGECTALEHAVLWCVLSLSFDHTLISLSATQEEERATGRVDIHVYITYFAHWGRRFWLPALAVLICSAARLDQV